MSAADPPHAVPDLPSLPIVLSRDATKYGSSRTSPTNFYIHHVQRISVAAVSYDAKAIRKAVCGRKQQLLSGRTAGAGL